MRAYVECSPNQSKNYTLSTFPSSNLRNFEDSRIVLAVSASQFYQSMDPSHDTAIKGSKRGQEGITNEAIFQFRYFFA